MGVLVGPPASRRPAAPRFLYSDEVQIGPETVMTTLYTAKKYAVPALEAHCVEFLKKNLRADNAFMLLTQVGGGRAPGVPARRGGDPGGRRCSRSSRLASWGPQAVHPGSRPGHGGQWGSWTVPGGAWAVQWAPRLTKQLPLSTWFPVSGQDSGGAVWLMATLSPQARLFDEPQLASLCLESIDKHTADAIAAEGFTDIDLGGQRQGLLCEGPRGRDSVSQQG